MPLRHRRATEEDLATWPALFVGFGKRPNASDDKPEPTPEVEPNDNTSEDNGNPTDHERRNQ